MSYLHAALFTILLAGGAQATPFDGIYRPDYPGADSWSCLEAEIGMDGGAVAILDGQIHGVENTCDMTDPRPLSERKGMAYTLNCQGEGETYSERAEITRSENGIRITRDGHVSDWIRCKPPG